ncbi:MAG: RnfH family protein [Alcanivoracaceae bacterium]|nr:RnfH family protein [Alcanivoracaceae bacterium]
MFTVKVIYATLISQKEIIIESVKQGESINDVINTSGILNKYPEIDLNINKVGVYNQVKKLDDIVNSGDRVEIYRKLIADPKAVRRKRAEKQKQQGVV